MRYVVHANREDLLLCTSHVTTVLLISSFYFTYLEQHGNPIYGDVFGVLHQEQPNYEVLLPNQLLVSIKNFLLFVLAEGRAYFSEM